MNVYQEWLEDHGILEQRDAGPRFGPQGLL